jgi:HAD superfamily hydrolase (TIGR01509 family)
VNPTYRAIIFDMDGVLADSEPVYYDAMNAVLQPIGKTMTLELQSAAMGHGVEETWRILADNLGLGDDYEPLVRAYDAYLCEALALIQETLPGVRELLDALRARNVPVGLASSSWPGWIEALLRGTDLRHYFDAIVSRTEVPHGKPAPDVYLEAARRLGVMPESCIGIEDTPTGLAAVRAAGMLAVQVRAASTAFPSLEQADVVLETLLDFDLTLVDP